MRPQLANLYDPIGSLRFDIVKIAESFASGVNAVRYREANSMN